MRRLSAVLTMTATVLAACTPPADPADIPADEGAAPAPSPSGGAVLTYTCESGGSLSVRYPDNQSAEVTYAGRTTPMSLAPSGSGARYAGGDLEWFTATRDGEERGLLGRADPRGGEVQPLEACSRPAQAPGTVTPAAPATPAQPSACDAASLRAATQGGDAGAGNRVLVVSLQNVGAQPCTLNGYPAVRLTGADGPALAQVRSENTPSNYFRPENQPAPVTLSVEGKAFFDIAWSAMPREDIGETACPLATGLSITPPGGQTAVALASPLQPCARRVRVSPVRAVAEPPPAPEPASPAATVG